MSNATRRVVTGHDDSGKAIIESDGPAPNVKVREQRMASIDHFLTAFTEVRETATVTELHPYEVLRICRFNPGT